MNGWIKIHRKFIDWEWYDEGNTVHLFLTFLLLANHEDKGWRGVMVKRGQLITGLYSLRKKTGISIRSLRTSITRLISTGEITSRSTNKYRIITIVNWDQYQYDDKKRQSKRQAVRQSSDNQPTTNKNVKNDKKNTIQAATPLDVVKVFEIFQEINPGIAYGNITQRNAASWLIKKYGLDKAVGLAKAAVAVHGKQYAPVITTPYLLKLKLGELSHFYKKQNDTSSSKVAFIS